MITYNRQSNSNRQKKGKSLRAVLEGSEGEERGETGGVRGVSGW